MTAQLKSIPGEKGLPVFGHLFRFIKNCNNLFDHMHEKYGSVYYNYFLNAKAIHLLSPEGNEFVLLDRDKNFSSRKAWNTSLSKLFPNGLMLRDGEEHRYHRRLMGAPFKAHALESYVDSMNPDIASTMAGWGLQKDFHFYPAIKDLTLSLASKIFIGESLSNEAGKVNNAFVDVVDAAMVVVRYPMLGNKYQKGLEGRAFLEQYFGSRVDGKQESNDTDMFAEISRAQSDDGTGFSKQDIIDHIIFLMMAAHDTTTSSLSSVCFALAKNPEWQERIRAEINAHGGNVLSYAEMPSFDAAGLVLKEALRLYPPLPTIPRAAIKDCEFDGYQIKQGEQVFVSPSFTHRRPDIWSDPNNFDPDRFNKERAEDKKHKHAWIPFGGGAHKCLGIKFAELQVKLILFHLLKNYQISVPAGYEMPYSPAPIGKPSDLLPLKLTLI
jgi:cytochrome P450